MARRAQLTLGDVEGAKLLEIVLVVALADKVMKGRTVVDIERAHEAQVVVVGRLDFMLRVGQNFAYRLISVRILDSHDSNRVERFVFYQLISKLRLLVVFEELGEVFDKVAFKDAWVTHDEDLNSKIVILDR